MADLQVPMWLPVALGVGAVVAWRLGRLLVAVALVAALALSLGVLPRLIGTGPPVGGPLAVGAPVPAVYRPWIERAGSQCPQVSPALLAAQLSQESGFNPRARSAVGAQGIAQFMPGTWPSWAVDADRDGTASPWDPPDAITAQGRFMCHLATEAAKGLATGRLSGDVVELALAGYNAGFGAVRAAGGVPSIPQTRGYVRSILAATHLYSTSSSSSGVPA
ncbi:transglycosylase SLT domain-containing protein [Pseudofrankia asymbiotica]|uniref:Lytic transglycosylase n=1 Tax=Pseudofrankia asymbiotica TaxID=1834516 RepID=A0A1V2I241_9ACTN|nr:lytic transglycosylase domain-containing protein [Pseudofrankia asymbiotica]ONH23822.1 lytic transglycosylase [Pseudofrankia asymbiotica]